MLIQSLDAKCKHVIQRALEFVFALSVPLYLSPRRCHTINTTAGVTRLPLISSELFTCKAMFYAI